MRIGNFWVVVNPSEHSVKEDICFQATPLQYFQYCLGATSGENQERLAKIRDENHMFFADERAARTEAEGRIRIRETIKDTAFRSKI